MFQADNSHKYYKLGANSSDIYGAGNLSTDDSGYICPKP
jgi:hypothetical protein